MRISCESAENMLFFIVNSATQRACLHLLTFINSRTLSLLRARIRLRLSRLLRPTKPARVRLLRLSTRFLNCDVRNIPRLQLLFQNCCQTRVLLLVLWRTTQIFDTIRCDWPSGICRENSRPVRPSTSPSLVRPQLLNTSMQNSLVL
jgi:hypothetical protein